MLADPDCDFDLVDYFQDLVATDLAPALDTDVWEIDMRANAYNTEITNVESEGDNIVVYYDVEFDAHYGCRDQNWAGSDERHIAGTRVGDSWVFPRYVHRVPRDTVDEF
ncbi:MAG TPA: hypothetical protein VLI46_03885 [Ramlibacter sp.]|nr:hypothetical protein [Ramlibacter sp.]